MMAEDIRDHCAAKPGAGYIARDGAVEIKVRFSVELFQQIHNEATVRGWPIARMVRHLCEASIEGIP